MFEKEIEAGVEYLDGHYPNWLKRVRSTKLDMIQPESCVLAQVSGTSFFDPGLEIPRPDFEYGFAVKFHWGNEPLDDEYKTLTKEWRKKIKELRKALKNGK